MPAYKTYRWENETWPEFREAKVDPETQVKLVRKWARHFRVPVPVIRTSVRTDGRGWYAGGRDNGLIKVQPICPLGVLVHEFAHHLDRFREVPHTDPVTGWTIKKYKRGGGHGKEFKRELKRVYTWAARYLEETRPPRREAEAA